MPARCQTCRRRTWLTCYFLIWLPLIVACGWYHWALLFVLPAARRFPQNLRSGFSNDLGFARLKAELVQVQGAARDALQVCGFDVQDHCYRRRTEMLAADWSRWTDVQRQQIEDSFARTLSKVQRVASDAYLGTAALAPTASRLRAIRANVTQIRLSVQQPCRESGPAYCGVYEAARQALSGMGSVEAEIDRLTGGEELQALESNPDALGYLHLAPYAAVASMILFSFWMAKRVYRWRICSRASCCILVAHALLCFASLLAAAAVCLVGLGLRCGLAELYLPLLEGRPRVVDLWPSYLLRGQPALVQLMLHLRAEFPELWETLFGEMEYGPEVVWLVSVAIEAYCILVVPYGICFSLCRPLGAKTARGDAAVTRLIDDILRQDAWPGVPQGEIEELYDLSPCQLKALHHVRTQCRELHLQALPELKRRARSLGSSDQDVEEALTWIRERAPIIVHVDLEANGPLLAGDTHYRNQFETNRSRGTLDHKKRSRWEDDLFDSAYSGAASFERCKYGVLNVVNDPQGVRSCRQYGLSYLLLRNTRLRTTFSATDSAGISSEHLATVDYFAHVLNRFTDQELTHALRVGTVKVQGMDSAVLASYKEAQVHGEVRLADHIELIMAHTSLSRGGASAMLKSLADRCRAEVVWIEGGIDRPPGPAPAVPLRSPSPQAPLGARAVAFPEVWEVEGDDGWTLYTGASLAAIREARAAGRRFATFEARGFHYQLDLDLSLQRNTTTGRCRRARLRSFETCADPSPWTI